MKKGQGTTAAGTAVLLAVIVGLIVMFVILIPPQERAKLLDEDFPADKQIEQVVSQKNLLTISPGRVDYLTQKEIEHALPLINIYTRTENKVLAEKNIAYAKKAVFSEETSTFLFEIPDLGNSKKVFLNFDVVQGEEGKLVVTLNEEKVFSSEVSMGTSQSVPLSLNLLQEKNVLTFIVSSPGIAFWATNEVSLKNIEVVAEVTSVESQSSKNIFQISEVEMKNLDKVVLRFKPECVQDDVGKLTVLINERVVYEGVPNCNLETVPVEIASDNLNQGENKVLFSTEKGMYLLSHVMVESKLKDVIFPNYYFDLSYEEYNEIIDGNKRLRLTMDFVDVIARKYGNLLLNGHVNHFDTKELSYAVDLSEEVVQGTNAIMIKPKKTLDVRELKVDLIK